MNLYLIKQPRENVGYDSYDSAVVAAMSEDDARAIHPSAFVKHVSANRWMGRGFYGDEYPTGDNEWVPYSDRETVSVDRIGTTNKPHGVILSSFNAG